MKELPLPRGRVALVDDDVWVWASEFRWYAYSRGYVWRKLPLPSGKRGTSLLRREIMQPPPGFQVLNRKGDQLDNRRENLVVFSPAERAAQRSDRMRGHGPRCDNTSGFRGVSWDRHKQTWDAAIWVSGKLRHLGGFPTAEAAGRAWDDAAREAWGEVAFQNFGSPGSAAD